jgi:hypothetical protein
MNPSENHYDEFESTEMNRPYDLQAEGPAENFQYSTYPSSFSHIPHYLSSQAETSYDEFSSMPGYLQYPVETGVSMPVLPYLVDPVVQGKSVAKALSKPPTTHPPSHLQHVQHLYGSYAASYDDNALPNATRMEHANALAFALLQYYYPEAQGYMIQPSSLGPIAKHGINFLLKAEDGSDPDFNALPPKKDAKKDAKKNKKKKPTKKQLENQESAEYARQFDHWYPRTVGMTWHDIEPEDITGFEVLKRTAVAGAKSEFRPYTYFAIMIDDLEMFSSFATTNDVHRGDILTDVLCRTGQIQSGYGILLFGTRLEFYSFDNGAETRIEGDDSDDYVEGMVSIDEPGVRLTQFATSTDMVVDLRETGLQLVDSAFKVMRDISVEYLKDDTGVEHGQDDEAQEELPEVVLSGPGDRTSGPL